MKKILQKVLGQPFIKGFVLFYQSAESDITSIAVAYYLLISIFPLMLIAATILYKDAGKTFCKLKRIWVGRI